MRLDKTVMLDMTDFQAALGERPRHQKATVAIEWITLRTHQAYPVVAHLIHQMRDGCREPGCARHRFVIGNAVQIQRRIARTAAERFAAGPIPDAFSSESLFERLLREPRAKARKR